MSEELQLLRTKHKLKDLIIDIVKDDQQLTDTESKLLVVYYLDPAPTDRVAVLAQRLHLAEKTIRTAAQRLAQMGYVTRSHGELHPVSYTDLKNAKKIARMKHQQTVSGSV